MTGIAKPATKANELWEELDLLVNTTGEYRSPDDLVMRRLWAQAEKLSQANACAASEARACLCCLQGDLGGVEYWCTNLARLQGQGAFGPEMMLVANLGYFSRAHDLYPKAVDIEAGNLRKHLADGLVYGAIEALLVRAEQATRAKLELDDTTKQSILIATECQAAMRRADIAEADVTALLDVAGEVMRERRMFWMERYPVVRVANTEEDVGLLYQFPVPVGPSEAADMTDEVILRSVERGLDRPGLTFSFLAYDHESDR